MKKMMNSLARLFFRISERFRRAAGEKPTVADENERVDVERAKVILNAHGYVVMTKDESVRMRLKNTSWTLKSFVHGKLFFSFAMRRRVLEAAGVILGEEQLYKAETDCYNLAGELKVRAAQEYAERYEERRGE